MGAIATTEDQRVGTAQLRIDGDIAFVQDKASFSEPRLGARPRHGQAEIRRQVAAIGQNHGTGFGADRGGGGQDLNALGLQGGGQTGPALRRQKRQKYRTTIHQCHRRGSPGLAQAVSGGHRKFHPADAAADDNDTRGGQGAGHKCLPCAGVGAQGFGGKGVLRKAGQVGQVRCDADVEGGEVVGQGRTTGQQDLTRCAVNSRGPVKDEPRPGETGEADEVNQNLLPPVVSCNMAGQHAGIGRHRVRVDQGQPDAGQRPHRPHSEDERMGMPPADEDQVADQGQVLHHSSSMAPGPYRLGPAKARRQALQGPARWFSHGE